MITYGDEEAVSRVEMIEDTVGTLGIARLWPEHYLRLPDGDTFGIGCSRRIHAHHHNLADTMGRHFPVRTRWIINSCA